MLFRVSISAWSPGWPRGGSLAQKHLKMEPQTCIFCYLRTMPSPSLETLWKCFVCSMNNNLIVLDVNLLFSLLRLGGKTYGGCLPDASQMLPRCFPDASQMLPRCLSDASHMPPRCLPLHDSFSMISPPVIPPP